MWSKNKTKQNKIPETKNKKPLSYTKWNSRKFRESWEPPFHLHPVAGPSQLAAAEDLETFWSSHVEGPSQVSWLVLSLPLRSYCKDSISCCPSSLCFTFPKLPHFFIQNLSISIYMHLLYYMWMLILIYMNNFNKSRLLFFLSSIISVHNICYTQQI